MAALPSSPPTNIAAPEGTATTEIAASEPWIYPVGWNIPSSRFDPDSQQWIRVPVGNQTFVIRTNDFGGQYAPGEPIPVAMEIQTIGINEAPRDAVLLHPHITVWIEPAFGSDSVPLQIENGLRIQAGQAWRYEFDLSKRVGLEPGTYSVAVGLTDPGGLRDVLRSSSHRIQIVPGKR